MQQGSSIAGWLVSLSNLLPLNFPIVFKLKHIDTLLICYSCSIQRRHSLISLTFFHILFNMQSCLLRQYTDYFHSASCRPLGCFVRFCSMLECIALTKLFIANLSTKVTLLQTFQVLIVVLAHSLFFRKIDIFILIIYLSNQQSYCGLQALVSLYSSAKHVRFYSDITDKSLYYIITLTSFCLFVINSIVIATIYEISQAVRHAIYFPQGFLPNS